MAILSVGLFFVLVPVGYRFHQKAVKLKLLENLFELAGKVNLKSFLFIFITVILGSLGLAIPLVSGFCGINVGVFLALEKEENRFALRNLEDDEF